MDLQGRYYDGKAVDVFAFGICLFEMLTMMKPFGESMTRLEVNRIAAHDVHYDNYKVENVYKNLIRGMLHIEPKSDRKRTS